MGKKKKKKAVKTLGLNHKGFYQETSCLIQLIQTHRLQTQCKT